MKAGRTCALLITVAAGTGLLLTCTGRERAARNEMLAVQPLIQQGDWSGLIAHLDDLIAEYPGTEAAATAAEMIAEARGRCNELAELKAREAMVTALQFFARDPWARVDLEDLVELGLKTDPDLTVTVVRGQQNDLEITARHVAGNRIMVIDHTGTVTSRAVIDDRPEG